MFEVAFWRNTFYHEKVFKGYINCSSGWAGPSKEARSPPLIASEGGSHVPSVVDKLESETVGAPHHEFGTI